MFMCVIEEDLPPGMRKRPEVAEAEAFPGVVRAFRALRCVLYGLLSCMARSGCRVCPCLST